MCGSGALFCLIGIYMGMADIPSTSTPSNPSNMTDLDAYSPIRAQTSSENTSGFRYSIQNISIPWPLDASSPKNDIFVIAISTDGRVVENLSSSYLSFDSQFSTLSIAPVFGESDFCVYIFRNEKAANLFSIKPDGNASLLSILSQFDKDNRILKQLQALQTRNLRTPDLCVTLPEAAFRKNKILSFDNDGNPQTRIVSEELEYPVKYAKIYAENAKLSADTAQQKAEEAADSANEADSCLKMASSSSQEASSSATQAATSATEASNSAQEAAQFRQEASEFAGSASEFSSSAQAAATQAQQSATAASESATSAKADAESAKQSSESANSSSQEAINSAENANIAASSASNSATAAQQSANAAQIAAEQAQQISDPNNIIGSLQVSKADTGMLYFTGRPYGSNDLMSVGELFSVAYRTDFQFASGSAATNQYKPWSIGSNTAYIAPTALSDDLFRILYNGSGFYSFKGANIRAAVQDINSIIAIVNNPTGGNITITLYVNGVQIPQNSYTAQVAQTFTGYRVNTQGGTASLIDTTMKDFAVFNFDMSAADAPYSIADYSAGKPVPPSALSQTAVLLENYTFTVGSTQYIPDVSGNNNDATIAGTGTVAGTFDKAIAKLASLITSTNA